LGRPDNQALQLRPALWQQKSIGSPWLRWHVNVMLQRADSGVINASTFDTGLFEKVDYWFFDDMVAAHGLVAGLEHLKAFLSEIALPGLIRRVAVSRWVLLLSCVAALVSIVLWHYAVMNDLRRSLLIY